MCKGVVRMAFEQKEKDLCLFDSMASCLDYMGYDDEAIEIHEVGTQMENAPSNLQLHALRNAMKRVVPQLGQVEIFNQRRRNGNIKTMTVDDLVGTLTPHPTVVVPRGEDLGATHALTVVDDWQARGLGSRMMNLLMDAARERGLKVMEGDVLASNRKMLRLCERLGFSRRRSSEDAGIVIVSRPL